MTLYLVCAICNAAAACYVFFFTEKAPRAGAFLLVCMAVWSLELFFLGSAFNKETVTLLFFATRICMFLLPAAVTILAFSLLNEKKDYFWYYAVIPSTSLSLLLWAFNITLSPSELVLSDTGYLPRMDTIYAIFLSEIIYCAIFTLIYSSHRLIKSNKREQLSLLWWIVLGTIIFVIGLWLSVQFITNSAYLSSHSAVAVNIVFSIATIYACGSHLTIGFKSAALPALTNATVLTPIIYTFSYTLTRTEEIPMTASLILATIIFLFVSLFAHRKVSPLLERTIQSITTQSERTGQPSSTSEVTELSHSTSIEDISDRLCKITAKELGIKEFQLRLEKNDAIHQRNSQTQLYYVDPQSPLLDFCKNHDELLFLDEHNHIKQEDPSLTAFDIAIPVRLDSRCIGAILLAVPSSMGFYNKKNISFLLHIKNNASEAIKRAIKVEKIEQQLHQSKKALSILDIANQYHHDIKTPLAVIDGVISAEIYDEETRRKIVIEQVQRGSQLITTMANLLKGRRERSIAPVDLTQTLKKCAQLFETYFDGKQLDLADHCHITGDDADLTIMFCNLIKNAAEAAHPEKENILSIDLYKHEKTAHIAIKDSGKGMNESAIENLWQTTVSTKEKGNAIGLQAVKRIAEEHNIAISVESTLNKGTTFHLVCPITPLEKGLAYQASEAKR